MNFAGLGALPIVQLPMSDWWRAVPPLFAGSPVPPRGFTHTVTTRFNAGDIQALEHRFDALYLAEDRLTCLYEFGALLGTPFRGGWSVPNPGRPCRVKKFSVCLPRIVDLTDPGVTGHILDLAVQDLTGDWDGYRLRGRIPRVTLPTGIAPTQQLGRALYSLRLDGFVTLSARVPTRRVLIVYDPIAEDGALRSGLDFEREEIVEAPPAPKREADPRRSWA